MAFTALRGVGRLRASDYEDAITDLRPLYAHMLVDDPLNASSTTLQDVTDLVVAPAINTVYTGWLNLIWTLATGVAEDIKVAFAFPTGAAFQFGGAGPHNTALGAGSAASDGEWIMRLAATSASTNIPFGASTASASAEIRFRLRMGSTAGNLQVMAAQLNSGVNVVTVKAGSNLELTKVG